MPRRIKTQGVRWCPQVKESDATETTPPGELKIELTVESPESQVYLVLVAIQFLLDHKALEPAFEITTKTLAYCQTAARRSLDTLHSSVWFYHSLCCEKKDMLPTIRPALLAAYRSVPPLYSKPRRILSGAIVPCPS
jgi:hypothetical protein